MEKENNQSDIVNHAAMKSILDSRGKCDQRKILENEDNNFFNDQYGDKMINYKLVLEEHEKEQIDTDDSNSSSESAIVLQQKHRNILRRCKIWRHQNINNLKKEQNKRKAEKKMITSMSVIEKMEEHELLLGGMIETANNFIEGMVLVFSKNEIEHQRNDEKVIRTLLSKIKNTLYQLNKQFSDIDEIWKITIEKNDNQEMNDDILALREQKLDILKKKDNIINELYEKLKELPYKLLCESLNNTRELFKLNKIADRKIKILKEENEKLRSNITKLIEDETVKNNNIDSTKWNALVEKIINKINSSAMNQYTILERNFEEIIQIVENKNHFMVDNCGKYVRMDAELKMVKVNCEENIEKLKHNCYVLKKTTEENTNSVVNQMRKIVLLQELISNTHRKFNTDSNNRTQISTIKKQIISLKQSIDRQKGKYKSVGKKANDLFLKIWNQQQNDIIHGINNVHKINNYIHEFLSINNAPDLHAESMTDALLQFKNINNMMSHNYPHKDTISNSYNSLRDNALNQLIIDYIVKNSRIVIDYNLNEIIDTKLTQSFPYMYNTVSAIRLNTEIWNLLKSKCKKFVMCVDCNSQVSWELNERIEKSNVVLEEKSCANITSDNDCTTQIKSNELLFGKLCTHKNQHNETIDKVIKSDLSRLLCNPNNTNYSNSVVESIDEELLTKYHTEVMSNDKQITYGECKNVNHQLSTIDDKLFIPIIEEVIKEKGSKAFSKPKLLNEYNYTWEMSENDLQAYWTRFTEYMPSGIYEWNIFRSKIKHYLDVLVAYRKLFLRTKQLQNENEQLKLIKYQLNEICLLKNITTSAVQE